MQTESTERFLDAVERGDLAQVVSLLDRGVDPDTYVERAEPLSEGEFVGSHGGSRPTSRETALELAIRRGHRPVAEVLLERGARATAAALAYACQSNDLALVRRLLDGGADPNELVWTAEQVDEDFVCQYTGRGMVTVSIHESVMALATRLDNRALFLMLVAAGGTPGKEAYRGVVWKACSTRDVEAVRAVLEAAERQGITVDPIVAVGQDPAVVQLVLEAAERQGKLLLPIDVLGHDPALVRFVLERNWRLHPESATPDARRAELTPCLMAVVSRYGVTNGQTHLWLRETAGYLIAEGADADFFDPRSSSGSNISPLHEALKYPYQPELIRLLLSHGARTTFLFEDGYLETALEVARRKLHPADFPWIEEILRPFDLAR